MVLKRPPETGEHATSGHHTGIIPGYIRCDDDDDLDLQAHRLPEVMRRPVIDILRYAFCNIAGSVYK